MSAALPVSVAVMMTTIATVGSGWGGTGVRRVNVRSQQHADTTAKRRLSVELLASIIRVRHYVRSAFSLVPSVL